MLRRLTGWAGEVLITLGVLLLLFAAWQLWWTDVVADHRSAQVVDRLREDFGRGPGSAAAPTVGPTGVAKSPSAPVDLPGDAFALMYVPRFGADWVRPVLEGTALQVLSEGVGHYDGTAAPGQVGNFAVAGHRTTWGRPFADIDTLRGGDRVVVETRDAVYVYSVTGHEVVPPTDVAVIAPVPDEPGASPTDAVLTMTSCHPRYTARERYVVHAALTETLPPGGLSEALAPTGGG